jgi:methyl coenzyme M reductase beta subunit
VRKIWEAFFGGFSIIVSIVICTIAQNATATAWYYKGICEKELGVPQDAADSWEAGACFGL